MKHLIILSLTFLFINCKAQESPKPLNELESYNKGQLALNFIKEYSTLDYEESQAWILNHPQVTNCVKDIYQEIINSDYVDADPILAAQDSPEAPYVDAIEDDLVIIKDKYWEDYVCYIIIDKNRIKAIGNINTNHVPGYTYAYKSLEPMYESCTNELRSEVEEIQKYINANLDKYRLTTINGNGEDYGTTEGGEEKFYFNGNDYVKIEKTFYGETGNRKIEYYFHKNTLRLYVDKVSYYNAPMYMTEESEDGMQAYDPKKTIVQENYYYFNNESDMFLWINEKGEKDQYSEAFMQKEEEINSSFRDFQ